MKVKCEVCGNYIQKQLTSKVENIYGKSDYDEVIVCNECAKLQHFSNVEFQRELHNELRKLVNKKKNKRVD